MTLIEAFEVFAIYCGALGLIVARYVMLDWVNKTSLRREELRRRGDRF